jgi:DNA-binding response OmpR family regulator
MISPCILVIDDDVKLLVKLEAVLKRASYRVLTASDGKQGIYLAQAAHPEVIICDVTLRSLDGFEVKRMLADDPDTSSIPFIVMTRRNSQADAGEDAISKPFDPQELTSRVNAMIRTHAYG